MSNSVLALCRNNISWIWSRHCQWSWAWAIVHRTVQCMCVCVRTGTCTCLPACICACGDLCVCKCVFGADGYSEGIVRIGGGFLRGVWKSSKDVTLQLAQDRTDGLLKLTVRLCVSVCWKDRYSESFQEALRIGWVRWSAKGSPLLQLCCITQDKAGLALV